MVKRRRALLLSGPNLNLLGSREPDIYGNETLADHVAAAEKEAEAIGWDVEHRQSNSSSQIVGWIQGSDHDAIIINSGAFTHYAWSIHDALKARGGVVVELHLSNPTRRESWRHESVIAPVASGTIAGFGKDGYVLAIRAAAMLVTG